MAAKRPNKKKGCRKRKREKERERDVVLLPSTRSIRWIIRATGEANRWRKKGTYRPLFGLNWSWLHFFLVNRSGLVDFIRFWRFFLFYRVFTCFQSNFIGVEWVTSLYLFTFTGFYRILLNRVLSIIFAELIRFWRVFTGFYWYIWF